MDIKNVEQCKTIYEGLKKNSFIVANIDKDFFLDFAETILNELDKKDKIINEMAMKINEAYFDENDFWLWFEKEICKGDMVKADKSKQIIDYFTKKAEGK